MNNVKDHIKPKTILKMNGVKRKGICSLIESSFQVAHKIAEKSDKKELKENPRYSELQFNDDIDSDDEKRSIEHSLSNSLTMSTFKRIHIKRRLKVVAVFSDRDTTMCALEQLKGICEKLDAELTELKFEKLDFGEYNVLDLFYNADICVVDMSVLAEQASLFYHLGVRESMGMKDNIVVVEDENDEKILSLKVSFFEICKIFIVNMDLKITKILMITC